MNPKINSLTKWLCRRSNNAIYSPKVKKQLQALYPYEDISKLLFHYYAEKIKLVIKIMLFGVIIIALMCIKVAMEQEVVDGSVTRNEYGKGVKTIVLQAEDTSGYRQTKQIEVAERQFTKGELEELYTKAIERLDYEILNGNKNIDDIRQDLFLPALLEGIPFSIRWGSNNLAVITDSGEIGEEIDEKGEKAILTATLNYAGFSREYQWIITVYPPIYSEKEWWNLKLEKALSESQKNTLSEPIWKLPDVIEGKEIVWEEKKDFPFWKLWLLLMTCIVLVYIFKDVDLKKQVEKKKEIFTEEYSAIVHKLVLYLGAGMTTRNAWQKIAYENQKRKKEGTSIESIYEEMLFSCREMNSGVSELRAYEKFGRRCGLQSYIRLSTMLVQGVKKGNLSLLSQLREEVIEAMENKKHIAKRKGEEAGTKMLVPMILMLAIVLVLVMIPAFGGIK